jgi:hypothetical protein
MKLKERSWRDLSRDDKAANVMYPGLAEEARRKEMDQISRGEGRQSPTQRPSLLSDRERGAVSPLGGQATDARGKGR